MIPTESRSADIHPIVFILDCDNTLLDNDAVKSSMDERLRELLGASLTDEFWRVYETVRVRNGTVDLPATFAEFRSALSSDNRLELVRQAIMGFPFQDFLYPASLDTLATLKRYGRPVIVSDGDAVYQPHKLVQSGLASAVDGQWVVYIHKEDHLDAIMDRWPAEFYVMIDDKGRILAETKRRSPDYFVTVHLRQGHYASQPASPAPDISLESIGAVRDLNFASLRDYISR